MKLLQYVVRSMDQNVYIYFDEESKEGVIVDPGNDAARIAQVIKEHEIDVKAILLTHGHGDHTGAVADLKAELGCKVGAHRWEIPVLEDERISFSAMYGSKKFDVDMIFEDGDEFKFGGTSLKVIHTPGHTQGGVCYYDETNKILFSGDTLFYVSIGRTDFPNPPAKDGIGYPSTENFKRIIDSIKEKLYVLPEETAVYTGHGSATNIRFEKKFNGFVKA